MKKIISLTLCAVMVLSLAACGSAEKPVAEKPGDTMSLEEIFTTIMDGVADLPEVGNDAVTDELFESYLFVKPIEGAEARVSEAMINAVAHSAVLLRVPEGTDAAAVATEIETNANPRKWVCTEAEKVIVTVHGSTILLVMSFTDTADAMTANFNTLWE